MKYVIGVTGNIATGKSTVLDILRELGAHVIDADAVTRRIMRRGEPAFDQIVAAFGPQIVDAGGELDRGALGRRVFADPVALRTLERIVHPLTLAAIRREIDASTAGVVVVEAIKLIESGFADEVGDSLWVVDAPAEVQLQRLVERRGMSREEALQRIAAQPPQAEKLLQADVVIENAGSLEETRRQVYEAWVRIPPQCRSALGTRPVEP